MDKLLLNDKDTWGWREVKLFVRFSFYSMTCIATFSGLWVAFDLPQVASKSYVDDKFHPVNSQLVYTRIQLNKMTRQALEAEKYRLTKELQTNNSFEVQQRLNSINDELDSAQKEKDNLLSLKK